MLYTIFDIETTGFSGSRDDVIQFAYLTVNERLIPVGSGNLYFYRPGMPWSTEAEAVHGIHVPVLKAHAEKYEHNLQKMYSILQQGNLVGHNSQSFDIPFVNQYMMRMGLEPLTAGLCYDTMALWRPAYGKRMKLTNLAPDLGFDTNLVQTLTRGLFRDQGSALRPHDACYDVVATYLCFRKAVQKGICNLTPEGTSAKVSVSI